MKKTYLNPTLKVVKIQLAHILTGSEQVGVGNTYNGETVLSRRSRFSNWEEEEEEY